MKPQYFILFEDEGDRRHIGTVAAETDEELNLKVAEAIKDHFDADVTGFPNLACEMSGERYFSVLVTESDDDGDEVNALDWNISIQPTWLY